MVIKICPSCQRRYVIAANSGDYVHNCADLNTNTTLGQEDILVIGNMTDADGTEFVRSPQEVMRQGIENNLAGTRAGVEGADDEDRTQRGKRAGLYRQISRLTYIDEK